jgi:hypothetical protein
MYRVIEKTKHGGSKISSFRLFSTVLEKLPRIKTNARVEKNGVVVGGVRQLDGLWIWSIENEE